MSNFTDGLDLDTGLLYNVEFNDGTTRLLRKIDPGLRVIGYPYMDVATREVVIQTWLIIHGNNGPKPIRFSKPNDIPGAPNTPAFGGAVVTKMTLAVKLGGTVSWSSQAGGHSRIKTGVVEEIVPSKEVPDRTRFPQLYRSSGVGAPRNHRSFVVRVPGKTPESTGKVYWPRVSSITQN